MTAQLIKGELTWRQFILRIAIVIATAALIVWIMPSSSSNNFHAELGKPWKYGELTAPFDFPIYKSEETINKERDSLLRAYEPFYNYNEHIEKEQIKRFTSDFSNGIPGLGHEYVKIIANQLSKIYQKGIISSPEYAEFQTDSASAILIVKGKNAVSTPVSEIYSTKAAYEMLYKEQKLAAYRQSLQKCNLNEYIKPNLIYDEMRSESTLNELQNSIPLAMGVAQKGQKLIDRGDIVDEYNFRVIESLRQENDRRSYDSTQMGMKTTGNSLYILILISFFTIYLILFRKQFFEKLRSMTMLYALILLFAILTSFLSRSNIGHVFILPYAMVPIFIRIFMDSRTAYITHVNMILICAIMMQHPFSFIVIEIVAGMAAIYSLRELSTRSQIFKSAIIITLMAMLTCLAFDLTSISMLSEIDFSQYQYLMVNGLLLLFAYPLLYLMEKTFGFISDITLIELSNTNNELLRKMSEVAPGTFQHSIQVGNLAAEIANKIGAKSQLVRTGALYHDIGKTLNPIYFTENQSGVNPHEHLSYIDSAQTIISHVTEGLKLAEKHNLPTVIKEFISTHHGLGKTKYFYVKQKNENPDAFIDDLMFTYPGPNPFTREQAILMMADAVEASSRSLPDYTEQTIRELVNKIIDGQLADGYFRECPITFRDIAYAKTVLIEKLKTIYHTRVSYPKENK